jgi:hypothetical protein
MGLEASRDMGTVFTESHNAAGGKASGVYN